MDFDRLIAAGISVFVATIIIGAWTITYVVFAYGHPLLGMLAAVGSVSVTLILVGTLGEELRR